MPFFWQPIIFRMSFLWRFFCTICCSTWPSALLYSLDTDRQTMADRQTEWQAGRQLFMALDDDISARKEDAAVGSATDWLTWLLLFHNSAVCDRIMREVYFLPAVKTRINFGDEGLRSEYFYWISCFESYFFMWGMDGIPCCDLVKC